MASLLTALALSVTLAPAPADPLPSREWPVAYVRLADLPPDNFDLFDVRWEMTAPPQHVEVTERSAFRIKRHIGFGGGYDQGIFHASVGFYVTVAEWRRWSFGTASPAIGFGRYQVYDRREQKYMRQLQSTILISLASVHYRGGYLRSIGKYWYINVEQVFDSRANVNGSQFGISFANE